MVEREGGRGEGGGREGGGREKERREEGRRREGMWEGGNVGGRDENFNYSQSANTSWTRLALYIPVMPSSFTTCTAPTLEV